MICFKMVHAKIKINCTAILYMTDVSFSFIYAVFLDISYKQ